MVRRFRWNSFRLITSISMSFVAVAAVIAAVFVISNKFNQSLDIAAQNSNNSNVNNLRDSIGTYLDEMIVISEHVETVLRTDADFRFQSEYDFIMRQDINTIAIFDNEGTVLMKSTQQDIKDNISITSQDWFNLVAPGSKIIKYTQPHVQRLYDGQYPWVISLVRGVEWIGEEGKRWGIVMVDMKFDKIRDLCETEIGTRSTIYLLDSDNHIIYHPNQQMLYAGIEDKTMEYVGNVEQGTAIQMIDGQRYVMSVSTIRSNGWKVVGVSELNGISYYDSSITQYIVGIVVLMTVVIVIAINAFTYLLTMPLKNLISLMKKAKEGELSIQSEYKGYYEIEELSNTFNSMIRRIKELLNNIVKEQEQLRISEMKTLFAQINSHFLYNTLDSIIWMVESGDKNNSIRMLSALASFFRLSLSQGRDMITVDEEIRHVENYLIIQKMRFNDQFDYQIDVDETVAYCKTLKMILQPIVENSIIHGVSRLMEPGKIEIRVWTEMNDLIFTINDNGYGMSKEQLESILVTDPKGRGGFGIWNVQQRIRMMFGEAYGLQYQSELEEGTKVRIRLPMGGGELE